MSHLHINAEALLDICQTLKVRSSKLSILDDPNEPPVSDAQVAIIDLAIKFSKLPARTQLRAIVEQWDIFRIVREVH